MVLNAHYHPLFSLRFEHDAQLDLGPNEYASLTPALQEQRLSNYQLHSYLKIQPTQDCQSSLEKHRLKILENTWGVTIFAQTITDPNDTSRFVLAQPLTQSQVLRFHVFLKGSNLANSANLNLEDATENTYYFSNKNQHREGDILHLTRPVEAFDPLKSYRAGDLIVDRMPNPSTLLEAVRDLNEAVTPVIQNWLQLPTAPYVAGTDYPINSRVLSKGKIYESSTQGIHTTPPAAPWRELYQPELHTGATNADRVTLFNPRQVLPIHEDITFAKLQIFDPDNRITFSKLLYHETGERLTSLQLPPSNSPAGFFRIEVKDATGAMLTGFPRSYYLETQPPTDRIFSVIEIFDQLGSHAILGPEGHLLAPVFHVRFRKRHTHWRYIFHGDLSALPPTTPGDVVQEDLADVSRFVTSRPLPVTTGSISLARFGETIFLPNPDINSTTRDGDKLYSETFIHL